MALDVVRAYLCSGSQSDLNRPDPAGSVSARLRSTPEKGEGVEEVITWYGPVEQYYMQQLARKV